MTQLVAGRISLAEYKRNVYVAVVPQGVTLEQALVPEFWAHVAQNIKTWDRIELRAEDKSWYADCVVINASRLSVSVRPLVVLKLDAGEVGDGSRLPASKGGYHVDYGGPIDLYRVIRNADSTVMTQGLSQTAAHQWIAEHEAAFKPTFTPVETAPQPEPPPEPPKEEAPVSEAPTAKSAVTETPASRAAVEIPANWGTLGWQERRSIASKLTDEPVRNGSDAEAAIRAELARREA